MLLDIRCGMRAARVAGDNLNVVRYSASDGRIRKPHVQQLLEGPLGDCAARGWAVNWAAVRRREKEAADEAATEGVYMAARKVERGDTEPLTRITSYGEGRDSAERGGDAGQT